MKQYILDLITKELLREEDAVLDIYETRHAKNLDSKAKQVFIVFPNTTFDAPPEEQEGFVRVYNAGTWRQLVDNRGTAYFVDGSLIPVIIDKIDVEIPEGSTTEPDATLLLERGQNKCWNEVKELREEYIFANLEFNGDVYQMNQYSLDSIKEAIETMPDSDEIQWRLDDNTEVALSKIDLIALRDSRNLRKLLLSKASWLVETDILTSLSPSELDIKSLYDTKISELIAGV